MSATEFLLPEGITTAEAVVLRLQPGDILVPKVPKPISMEDAETLSERAGKRFGVPVVVLGYGLDVEVLRKEGA